MESIFLWIFLVIAGFIVSTVYLRYHYVIDLIAEAVISAGCLPIGLRLHAWWDRLYMEIPIDQV